MIMKNMIQLIEDYNKGDGKVKEEGAKLYAQYYCDMQQSVFYQKIVNYNLELDEDNYLSKEIEKSFNKILLGEIPLDRELRTLKVSIFDPIVETPSKLPVSHSIDYLNGHILTKPIQNLNYPDIIGHDIIDFRLKNDKVITHVNLFDFYPNLSAIRIGIFYPVLDLLIITVDLSSLNMQSNKQIIIANILDNIMNQILSINSTMRTLSANYASCNTLSTIFKDMISISSSSNDKKEALSNEILRKISRLADVLRKEKTYLCPSCYKNARELLDMYYQNNISEYYDIIKEIKKSVMII